MKLFTITEVADIGHLTVFECRLTFYATVLHDTDDILSTNNFYRVIPIEFLPSKASIVMIKLL